MRFVWNGLLDPTVAARGPDWLKTMMRNPQSLIVVGLYAIFLLGSGSAAGAPLAAFTDHSGEDHSFEKHRGEDLESIILSGADLTKIDFRDAILRNAIMISAILIDAKLDGADLTGADLTNALMSGVKAKKTNFTNVIFDGASFATGDIRDAIFIGTSLLGTDLSSLKNANKADFSGAVYDATTLLAPGMDLSVMTFVPEPSPAILLLLGLCGLQMGARRLEDHESSPPRC